LKKVHGIRAVHLFISYLICIYAFDVGMPVVIQGLIACRIDPVGEKLRRQTYRTSKKTIETHVISASLVT